jgi:hypothetical protein
MCDGMSPLGLPFEKAELEAFLKGQESIQTRLGDQLQVDESAAVMGTRELLQELIHRLHHEQH